MLSDQIGAPSKLPPTERHRRRWAALTAGCLGLGLACAAFEVAWTVKIAPWLMGTSGTYTLPADIWRSLQPARWVANGAVLFLYESEGPRFDYGPVWPVVVAPRSGGGRLLEALGQQPLRGAATDDGDFHDRGSSSNCDDHVSGRRDLADNRAPG